MTATPASPHVGALYPQDNRCPGHPPDDRHSDYLTRSLTYPLESYQTASDEVKGTRDSAGTARGVNAHPRGISCVR